jgi:hypothetical protein
LSQLKCKKFHKPKKQEEEKKKKKKINHFFPLILSVNKEIKTKSWKKKIEMVKPGKIQIFFSQEMKIGSRDLATKIGVAKLGLDIFGGTPPGRSLTLQEPPTKPWR